MICGVVINKKNRMICGMRNDFLLSTTTKSNGHLADFVGGVALAPKEDQRNSRIN